MACQDISVGVEVEFSGLSAREAAQALSRALGGVLHEEDAHAFALAGSRIGDLTIELDLRHVHPHRSAPGLKTMPAGWPAALLGSLAKPVVPREAIFPPRPSNRLHEIDLAIAALREAGARGDGVTAFDTLGLHFNIAARSLNIAAIRATTLAYARLDPLLRADIARGRTRLARRLASPYPDAYRLVLERAPPDQDVAEFIDDYLAHNPTRHRALDLLPLLLHLDGDRVRSRLPFEKIAPRPVYHWRLPVAHVGVAGWGLLEDWGRWLAVEAEARRILGEGATAKPAA
ncbi:MAG: amidoligase family protein [Beijerinckiaceae bacterium]|nr:amidoligase family protein [Beijerinckiaceae bacterium]